MLGLYAFGSLVRGELDEWSDIDLLAITNHPTDSRFCRDKYSVYTDSRIQKLWKEGNPFAWHLHLEAKPVYLQNGTDYLSSLGKPSPYMNSMRDMVQFAKILVEAYDSLYEKQHPSPTFELSTIFLAIRNAATAFSLRPGGGTPTFSRRAARCLGGESIPISDEAFQALERARVLSTRGYGVPLTRSEADAIREQVVCAKAWIGDLITIASK